MSKKYLQVFAVASFSLCANFPLSAHTPDEVQKAFDTCCWWYNTAHGVSTKTQLVAPEFKICEESSKKFATPKDAEAWKKICHDVLGHRCEGAAEHFGLNAKCPAAKQ